MKNMQTASPNPSPSLSQRRKPHTNEYYQKISLRFRIAKYGVFVALVAFFIFAFTFMRNDITLENLRYLLKYISFTNTETSIMVPRIDYDSGDPNRLELFVGDLATLTPSGYAIYDSRGNLIMTEDIRYSKPVLKVSKRFSLCYDLGGNGFTVLNTFASLYEGTTEMPITDASIADNGTFAIASSTREYRTQITLYDENFKPVSRILKNDHLMAAEMKPDGSLIAVLTVKAEGSAFCSRLELIAPGESSARQIAEFDGLSYSLYFTNEGIVVVTDEALCFFDNTLNLRASLPHSKTPVMTHNAGRHIVRILAEGIIGNTYLMEIYDLTGREVYSGEFTGKLTAVDSDDSGDYIFVLAGNQVIRVNLYNRKIASTEVEADAIDVLPQNADSFLLAKENYALTYDVNFEEVYFDQKTPSTGETP